MKLYLLPSDKIKEFFATLTKEGSVFYPVMEGENTHLVRFNNDAPFEPCFKKIRTAQNIKHFLFPSRDVVATFPKDKKEKSKKQYLFGVKSCDLRGLDVYDRVFLKTEPIDPAYEAKRANTVIISADCPEPADCCFCNLVGVNPFAEGISDLNFTELEAGLLFEAFTKKGEKIVEKMQDLLVDGTKDHKKEQEKIRKQALKELDRINKKEFNEKLPECVNNADKKTKHNARQKCVECFGCLHVCPTCYCFLLSDYQKGKDLERMRTWDACYYAAYARVGGGANPRSDLEDRFWNRFQCKFQYFFEYETIYACSGCGRCYRGCSGNIDIREILWQL